MTNGYVWTVHGDIVGKGRPRVTSRGGYAHAYTPKRTVEYERKIRNAFLDAYGEFPELIECPLELTVCIQHKIPDATPKKQRPLYEDNVIPPVKSPDVDNVVKAVADSLNNYLIKDDTQIVRLLAFKRWANEPSVTIILREWTHE